MNRLPLPALLLAVLPGLLAVALFLDGAARAVPGAWARALLAPDPGDLAQVLLHLAAFPRLAVALLSGALLAMAGALLQRLMANPLAEPGTLGAIAGAQSALTAVLIWWPVLAAPLGPVIALAGAVAAFSAVLVLAARQGATPVALILSGMVVTLALGGINASLALFHHEVLQSLFLWQGGALVQDGWRGAGLLALTLAAGTLGAALTARPLRVMETGDAAAASLGARPAPWRMAIAGLAVAMAAVVTAVAGVFAFLGLLAPILARLAAGGRAPLWAVAGTGAGLLALADQAVQRLPLGFPLPLGGVIALAGSALMLPLLRRLRPAPAEVLAPPPVLRLPPVPPALAMLGVGAALAVALGVGRTPEGWQVSLLPMLEWRLPRVLAALAAGMAFGLAGMLLQGLLGNRMASPELLGISGAAALGLILSVALLGTTGQLGLFAATTAGALAGLVLIGLLVAQSRFSPRMLLLAGLALSTLLSALMALLLASGHPLAGQLLGWLSGSTYRATLPDAVLALAGAAVVLAAAMLMHRWLDMLRLGPEAAGSLGLPLRRAQAAVVLAAALATAIGTVLVGPLGFVGLIAPNLAAASGRGRARAQLPAAAGFGAALMLVADWLGRVVAFPWQLPAGLVALLIGGGALILFLWRKPR